MFEDLKHWQRILVTGPQRSGTRIATRMIAEDTGFWFFPEENFGTDSLNLLWKLLKTSYHVVVQCPTMSNHAYLLAQSDPDLLVVMMVRDLEDIKASEERISWEWEITELIKMGRIEGNSAKIKYERWREQKPFLGNQGIEVRYDSLEAHPMFVAKPGRVLFGPRQTR